MDSEEAKDSLLKRYRAQHRECRTIHWTADAKGYADISVDVRCPLCKKVDELYEETPENAAQLRK